MWGTTFAYHNCINDSFLYERENKLSTVGMEQVNKSK